jgi:hypothetical protein
MKNADEACRLTNERARTSRRASPPIPGSIRGPRESRCSPSASRMIARGDHGLRARHCPLGEPAAAVLPERKMIQSPEGM